MRKRWFQPATLFVVLSVIVSLVFVRFASQVASAAPHAPAPRQPLATSVPDPQQFPIMDKIAEKIIQKYQTSSCEQLYQEKGQQQGKPKSAEEQRAITILHNDPQMRQAFINKIAAPIANKLFECGMIP